MSILKEFSDLCLDHQSLQQAIDHSLQFSPCLFFLLGDIGGAYCALYHSSDNGIFSYDPHAQNSTGLPSPLGTAVMVYHSTRQLLYNYATNLSNKLNAKYFEVVAVAFQKITVAEYRQQYCTISQSKKRSSLPEEKRQEIKNVETTQRSKKRMVLGQAPKKKKRTSKIKTQKKGKTNALYLRRKKKKHQEIDKNKKRST